MADDEYAVSKICRDKDHLTVFYTIISKRDIYKKERYGINKRLWQILMLKRQELCGDTDLSEERKARELISLLEADIAHVCLELSFPEGKPDGAVLLNQAFYRMEMERCSIGHVYDDPRLFLYAKLIKSCCSPHPDVRINGDTNTFSMYGITIYNLDAAECARYMEQIKSIAKRKRIFFNIEKTQRIRRESQTGGLMEHYSQEGALATS